MTLLHSAMDHLYSSYFTLHHSTPLYQLPWLYFIPLDSNIYLPWLYIAVLHPSYFTVLSTSFFDSWISVYLTVLHSQWLYSYTTLLDCTSLTMALQLHNSSYLTALHSPWLYSYTTLLDCTSLTMALQLHNSTWLHFTHHGSTVTQL